MLETRIAELTAAVEALTKAQSAVLSALVQNTAALGWVSASPGTEVHNFDREKMTSTITEKVVEVKIVPNETKKSETASSTSQASSPGSAPVTYDDVKRATNAVSKISREKAIAGLARFGVSSATKLTEQQWPGYVEYMTKVAAGEIDPEASHE